MHALTIHRAAISRAHLDQPCLSGSAHERMKRLKLGEVVVKLEISEEAIARTLCLTKTVRARPISGSCQVRRSLT